MTSADGGAGGAQGTGRAGPGREVGDSLTASGWTTLSRVSGAVRVAAVAAVLGPTFLGNLYQSVNLVPNLLLEFLTGSLFVSLLVPPLVRHLDGGDVDAARRLARGFLGAAMLGVGILLVLLLLIGPLVLRLLTAGVTDPGVAAAQREAGLLLLMLLAPQVLLYVVAGTGVAVQNAHGRFALAAAAPMLENLAITAMMAAFAVVHGPDVTVESISTSQLVLLGVGTTAGVGLHALAQWIGAARCGVLLFPTFRRDADLRLLGRMVRPSLGYAGLNALRIFVILLVANARAGGVVAFQIALQVYHLPVAVWSRPVAVALMPRLSLLVTDPAAFRLCLRRGLFSANFLVLPAIACMVGLADPLADALSFGTMDGTAGTGLIAVAMVALAVGVAGESTLVMGTHASYALDDARLPFRAMGVRTAFSVSLALVALTAGSAPSLLIWLGVAVSVGNAAGAVSLLRGLSARLPAIEPGDARRWRQTAAASVLMLPPAWLTVLALRAVTSGGAADLLVALCAGAVAAAVFLGLQSRWNSEELAGIRDALRRRAVA